jgi:hypothetical protein
MQINFEDTTAYIMIGSSRYEMTASTHWDSTADLLSYIRREYQLLRDVPDDMLAPEGLSQKQSLKQFMEGE